MNGSYECRTDLSEPSPRRRGRARRDISRVTIADELERNENMEPKLEEPPEIVSKAFFRVDEMVR